MTIVMSNIPLLYCLLYYRTVQQLKPARSSNFPGHVESDSLFQPDSFRNKPSANTFSNATHDPPWLYHSRMNDLNRLCSHVNDRATKGTQCREFSSDVCYVRTADDISKIFPQGFTSEQDLHKIILRLNWAGTTQRHGSSGQPVARYAINPHAQAALRAEATGSVNCGVCFTEVGYEVTAEVTDFNGHKHTVINLHNAYQFIPSGKCL
ncbi:hypothetical protein BsWGS_05543 [Bradybaena similaris]